MDDPHHTSAGGRPPNGRLPDVDQAAALHAQVADVLRVLQAAGEFAQSGQSVNRPRILARFGGRVEAAMLALGDTLAGFLFARDTPADLDALRADFLEPILTLSRSLAVYNRAEEWSRHKEKTGELHPLVLEGRAVGFDPETLLLDDFYKNTIFVRALRSRISVLARFFIEEAARQTADSMALRVLIVGANSVLQLGSPFPEDEPPGEFSVVISDADTQALRLARQRFEETFGFRPDVLRAKPESIEKSRRGSAPFDVVYTLMEYDMRPPEAALELTRSLCHMLKPGGALLTGSFLPAVPASWRALGVAIVDLDWCYRDEAGWREMLGHLPFDLSASRFEVAPPATLAVLARRRAPGAPA